MTLTHQEMGKAGIRASLGVTGKTLRHLGEMKGGKREVGRPKGHTAVAVKASKTHQADREKKRSAKGGIFNLFLFTILPLFVLSPPPLSLAFSLPLSC